MMRPRPLSLIAVFLHSFSSMLLIYALTTPASEQSLPRCHEEERSALLEFKQSSDIYMRMRYCYPGRSSVFVSWNPAEGGEGGNCCSWHGVQCDDNNGHVIGLDLSGDINCVYSSINSSSSLFRLTYLEKLDLSGIDFDDSHIPSAIGNFSRLKVLNLSSCGFTGQVPPEILGLASLSSLDLSGNSLKFEKPDMEDLARSLTTLEELNLSNINISAPLPIALANLTSLKLLVVSDCGLRGKFPTFILNLPNLQVLDVSDNYDLKGKLALPRNISVETGCASLRVFDASDCNLSGPIDPVTTLGNCSKLSTLRLSDNWFRGKLPSLVNLNKLTELDLSSNELTGEIPSSFGNLTLLSELDLSFNRFTGKLPSFLSFNRLEDLDLSGNAFTGEVPFSYGNLTMLSSLDLRSNRLSGQIPSSVGHLHQLSLLNLVYNSLTGSIPPSFGSLTRLTELYLNSNRLTGPIPSSIGNLTQLSKLYLRSNHLNGKIPSSIGKLYSLSELDVSSNRLVGRIPPSLGNSALVLKALDLRFNRLHGQPPNPPETIKFYFISNNRFSGELPSLICNLSRITMLDVAYNNFSGMIPQCLSNSSNRLEVLSLHDNHFSGAIPQSYSSFCALTMMDVSRNQLEGPLPLSLANCTALEFVNFGNNLIGGTFPSWMGSLSELRVLMLQSNSFHGEILEPKSESEFAKLHIIDVSDNHFVGALPFNCSKCWKGMGGRNSDDERSYIGDNFVYTMSAYPNEYDYSMTITNKGSLTVYVKIRSDFTVIDFSSNNFSGEIPGTFGRLKGLHLLNLSNNLLTGHIPPVLSNLTQLEAMDVSRNMLSGNIPYQLTGLSFLEVFNVSYNLLSGDIPRGKQFNAFDNSSYSGNVGLCGEPLSKRCGGTDKEAPPLENRDKGSNHSFELDWKIIMMGFASGTVVGVVMGQGMTIGQDNWFVRKLTRRVRRKHRQRWTRMRTVWRISICKRIL